ncbi:MAG: helix-turn-helix transcriptional regulator [Victivallales bacterium]|nr:helix-turn-helix transcriptional regulator [Victivallales bacterium]
MGTFNTRLREIMQEMGITQRALAVRLNIGEAALSKYLNEDRQPRIELLANMATALNTTTDYLLGHDDNREFDYRGVKRLLARNAANLTKEEKMELIDVLFKE